MALILRVLAFIGPWLIKVSVALSYYLVPAVIGMALSTLGIGIVTYTGLDYLTTYMTTELYARFDGLPADALGLLQLAGVLKATNIYFSAVAAGFAVRMALKFGGSGSSAKAFKFTA